MTEHLTSPGFLPSFALALVIFAALGCDGEPPAYPQSCQDITDACHHVDDGSSSEISECHDTAHDEGTAAACDPIVDRCVMLCEEAERSRPDAGSDAEH